MLIMFSGGDALKEESTRCLWILVFNAAVESIDKSDRNINAAH